MTNLGASVGWGLAIAGSLLAGALAAVLLRLPERVAATLTAFGGGILLAAIAFELVPDADAGAGTMLTAGGLTADTLVYVGADAWLNREPGMRAMRRSGHAAAAGRPMKPPARHDETARGEAITAGIFVDGVPESIALGLTIAQGELGVALLAGILLGNVVEAYGAAQPILAGSHRPGFILRLLGGIGLALAAATVVGGPVLAEARPRARRHGRGGRGWSGPRGGLDRDRPVRVRGGQQPRCDRHRARLRRRLPAVLSACRQRRRLYASWMIPSATLLMWFLLRSPELAEDFERLMTEDRDIVRGSLDTVSDYRLTRPADVPGQSIGQADYVLIAEIVEVERFEQQASEQIQRMEDDLAHLVSTRGLLVLRPVL